ncbi:MAG: 16S rRNA (adenine(1518)-N(6)/adenine(1519)-N(6))-dimethyltransferase RsmA [Gammaproteobacteria bacterium]
MALPDGVLPGRLPTGGARKRFGQHFLTDAYVLDEIVACIAPRNGEMLVEIGPGHGALTFRLLEKGAVVHAVELDRDLVEELGQHAARIPSLHVHAADALAFDFTSLPSAAPLRVVGNLPYNISTPLMLRLVRLGDRVQDMCFMLQREVAERMCALPGTAAYGRLSVLTQAFCTATMLLEVPPQAFTPPPKVDSRVILLRPHPAPCAFDALEKVVAQAFAHRRKMLRHTLGRQFDAATLAALGIALTDRPEDVTVAQYVALARHHA